jgi:hypothetical protein
MRVEYESLHIPEGVMIAGREGIKAACRRRHSHLLTTTGNKPTLLSLQSKAIKVRLEVLSLLLS